MQLSAIVADFLGDLPFSTFEQTVLDQRTHLAKGAFGLKKAASVCNLADLDRVLSAPSTSPADVDVIVNGQLRETTELVSTPGGVDALRVFAWYRKGATIRVTNMHRYVGEIALQARRLSQVFKAEVSVNLYLTPPMAQGFEPHFDDHDVFVLQCSGAKRWSEYASYTNMRNLPQQGEVFSSARHRASEVSAEFALEVGDVLYVPRGVMHSAQATAQPSLHLTFAISKMTWGGLLRRALEHAISEQEDLRRSVPVATLDLSNTDGLDPVRPLLERLWDTQALRSSLAEYLRGNSEFAVPPATSVFSQEGIAELPQAIRLLPEPVTHIEPLAPGEYRLFHRGFVVDLDDAGYSELQELIETGSTSFESLVDRRGHQWALNFSDELCRCGLVERVLTT